jgi:creatinine amidohydrolase
MKLMELSWSKVATLAPDTPVVIPIAAIEQHGHHLPVGVDSMLLEEIVRRVESRLADQILVTPLQWFGNSHHHLDFAGTLSASPRTYLDILNDLAECFLAHGFRRIVFVNGHGGNDVPAKQAIFEIRQRYRQRSDLLLLMTTYWSLGDQPGSDSTTLHQREMGHACEWETSMMLALAPQWVGAFADLPAIEPGNPFRPGTRAWITRDRSAPGYIGWPSLATAEKGERLLQTFSADLTRWLERVLAWDGRSWEG